MVSAETLKPANESVKLPAWADIGARRVFGGCILCLLTDYEFCDHGLREAGWLLRGLFSYADDTLHNLGLCGQPAKATSWSDDLRERVKPNDASLCVDGEVGRNKGVQEFKPRELAPCIVVAWVTLEVSPTMLCRQPASRWVL